MFKLVAGTDVLHTDRYLARLAALLCSTLIDTWPSTAAAAAAAAAAVTGTPTCNPSGVAGCATHSKPMGQQPTAIGNSEMSQRSPASNI
jgi:hypothetical protein